MKAVKNKSLDVLKFSQRFLDETEKLGKTKKLIII